MDSIIWKQKIGDFIEAIDNDMCDIVESRYEVPKIMINGIFQPKVKSFSIEQERKKQILASKMDYY